MIFYDALCLPMINSFNLCPYDMIVNGTLVIARARVAGDWFPSGPHLTWESPQPRPAPHPTQGVLQKSRRAGPGPVPPPPAPGAPWSGCGDKKKGEESYAPTGNRTRVHSVAGSDYTTKPSARVTRWLQYLPLP